MKSLTNFLEGEMANQIINLENANTGTRVFSVLTALKVLLKIQQPYNAANAHQKLQMW